MTNDDRKRVLMKGKIKLHRDAPVEMHDINGDKIELGDVVQYELSTPYIGSYRNIVEVATHNIFLISGLALHKNVLIIQKWNKPLLRKFDGNGREFL